MKKISLVCAALIFMGVIGIAFADQYAYTTAYFYLPSDVSFGVFLLGESINTSSIADNPPGNPSSTWISFNASTPNDKGIQPKTTGATINQQNGPTKSIIRIYNMGNINYKFYMNASVGQGCISLCANTTCGGSGCTNQPTCNPIKELSGTWATLSTNLPTNGYLNVTMYADFTSCSPPMNQQGAVYYKSSLT
jgi:hypothetical protein